MYLFVWPNKRNVWVKSSLFKQTLLLALGSYKFYTFYIPSHEKQKQKKKNFLSLLYYYLRGCTCLNRIFFFFNFFFAKLVFPIIGIRAKFSISWLYSMWLDFRIKEKRFLDVYSRFDILNPHAIYYMRYILVLVNQSVAHDHNVV